MTSEQKKRILIPVVGQGSVIHIIRTGIIDSIAEFATPVVAMLWQQKDLMEELNAKGYEVHIIPTYKVSAIYSDVFYKINLWYLKNKLKTPGVKLESNLHNTYRSKQTLKSKIIKKFRIIYNDLLFKIYPDRINRLIKKEDEIMRQEAVYDAMKVWLYELKADGLFTVTPFMYEVNLIARILKLNNKAIIASIHSFDNITKRGWQATAFDEYIVWNKYNKAELFRVNNDLQKRNAVHIAGAPQFDFHYNSKYIWSKEYWLKRMGIAADKKVVLYAGGAATLFPTEPQYALHIKEAIENNELDKDIIVLVRSHPLDTIDRWEKYIGKSAHVVYDEGQHGKEKLDFSNVTDDDLARLISTLYHSDVHVNLCSTMTVDGSVYKKPQVAPYYDDDNKAAEPVLVAMYEQEHFIPIIKSNVLNKATSRKKLIELVYSSLKQPNNYNDNCTKCVENIITYNDGMSAKRVSEILKSFFT